jgi:hypothetical protein
LLSRASNIMAFPLPRGITASEIAFLAEMETVTVVPRQRLEGLELLGVTYDPFLHTPSIRIDLFVLHPGPS